MSSGTLIEIYNYDKSLNINMLESKDQTSPHTANNMVGALVALAIEHHSIKLC